MKIGFLASTVLALFALAFQEKFYTKTQSSGKRVKGSLLTLWRDMGRGLKQLLISDVLARLASNMIGEYVVLYVINVLGTSPIESWTVY